MRITAIELEGFWSYRDKQRVEIGGLPLLVGVGENGTGKSTLLVQAVVVALYGRFPTKTNAESITTGLKQGRVAVEFLLGDTDYRVQRTYPRSGTASGAVYVADQAQPSGWRPLTEKGVNETTAFITDLLGMDYDTAAMTWIAEQGQYGRFSAAAPAERFKLLSSVFGLDEYADRAVQAKEKFKAADEKVARLDGQISELQDGLLGQAVDDDTSDTPVLTEEELHASIAEQETEVDRLSRAIADVDVTDPARAVQEHSAAWRLLRDRREGLLANSQERNRHATNIRDAAIAQNRTAHQQGDQRLRSAIAASDARVDQARATAQRQREQALAALSQISKAVEDREGVLNTLTAAASEAEAQQAIAAEAAEVERTAGAQVAEMLAKYNAAKGDAEKVAARIEKLRDTAAADHACYACGQHLSAEDASALIASQERELEALQAVQGDIAPRGKQAKSDKTSATERRTNAERAAAAAATLVSETQVALSRIDALIATREEREVALDEADILVAEVQRVERQITDDAQAEHEQSMLASDELLAAAVATVAADLEEIGQVIAANADPTEAEAAAERTFRDAEAAAAEAIHDTATRRAALESQRAGARAVIQSHTRELGRRAEVEAARRAQSSRVEALIVERDEVLGRRETWAKLVEAYSPTGIPAMILEGVVDEVSEAVNTSLTRLSRGELAVRISTVRESSTGKTTENKVTVYVETPTGTRAYETLSGGQRFRVDLAIRSGLAQVIARGTGTPIRTFILDEGWGTLDEKGIQSTIETLGRLSEDTSVITVSHIESVRDAFPARIEVSNVGGASAATVVR